MSKTTYNGWSNYPTWRINLEIFSDMEVTDYFDELPTTEMLEDYVENIVFDHSGTMGLIEDYARAFLANVDYREILESIKDDYELNKDQIMSITKELDRISFDVFQEMKNHMYDTVARELEYSSLEDIDNECSEYVMDSVISRFQKMKLEI